MCNSVSGKTKALDSRFFFFLFAAIAGFITGYGRFAPLLTVATLLSDLFIALLKLVSLPIIFLSIVSTAAGMGSIKEIRFLGLRILKYTLLTTLIAATVALAMFLAYDPVRVAVAADSVELPGSLGNSYWNYLLQLVPSSFLQPFVENNAISAMFLALALSLSVISLADGQRQTLHAFFSALYAAVMKMTTFVVGLMPLAVWAFVALFARDIKDGLKIESIGYYLAAVISANLIQGFVVLPLFLKVKGISPLSLFRAMAPALSLAFFSKSSSAALPAALHCAEDRAGISARVAKFSLPLCTSVNMNGCAAFILITVLFVSMSNGIYFSYLEMCVWIVVATIAAIGNAGVPMGCFFLSSAFLAAMGMPLNIMGVILPFYTIIDMLETSINVWSDSCVTAAVQKEVEKSESLEMALSNVTA